MKFSDSISQTKKFDYTNFKIFNEIILSKSINTIGFESFIGCTFLTSITISSFVTVIEDKAFDQCTSLESINVCDSIIEIGESAFYECSSLKYTIIL